MITIIYDARGLGDATSFFRESDENTEWMSHFIVGEAAGGGLMRPVTEMVRYAQMLANGGEGVDALLRVYYKKDGFAIALQANSGGYSRQDVMDAAVNVIFSMLAGQ